MWGAEEEVEEEEEAAEAEAEEEQAGARAEEAEVGEENDDSSEPPAVTSGDRRATRQRIIDTLSARYQQPSNTAKAMAANREAFLYNTRASDAAYLAMDEDALVQGIF
jgi:hypothetical protein